MTDDFFDAYVEALLWSSLVTTEDGETHPADFFPESSGLADALRADAEDFFAAHVETWRAAGWSDREAGHDFALTRHHHGAGFWDRGRGEAGQALTAAAHVYGDVNLYVEDGLVYVD